MIIKSYSMFNESTNLISHEEALDNINLIEDIFRDLLDQSENNGFSLCLYILGVIIIDMIYSGHFKRKK